MLMTKKFETLKKFIQKSNFAGDWGGLKCIQYFKKIIATERW